MDEYVRICRSRRQYGVICRNMREYIGIYMDMQQHIGSARFVTVIPCDQLCIFNTLTVLVLTGQLLTRPKAKPLNAENEERA